MKKYWDTLSGGQKEGVLVGIGIVSVLWSVAIPVTIIEVAKMVSGCQ